MAKRKTAKQVEKEQKRWRTYSLIFVCGMLMVAGVFFAGRQHFSWMDYGMKNSKLRKQIEELEGEKRRLLLAREISLSPMEIKKAAKKIGINNDSSTDQPTLAQIATTTKDKAVPPVKTESTNPMIEKTAAVSPSVAVTTASLKKVEKPVRSTTKPPAAE